MSAAGHVDSYARLLSRLLSGRSDASLAASGVLTWSSPVIAFGDPARAVIATVGINPSNREFMDTDGRELDGHSRRFPTLSSLGLSRWSNASDRHVGEIVDHCVSYFARNPYHTWFRSLDVLLGRTSSLYRDCQYPACHVDLVPYATVGKWNELSLGQKGALLQMHRNVLAELLALSPVELLVLNGASVVRHFEQLSGVSFKVRRMTQWTLPRQSGAHVVGVAYAGSVTSVAGVSLKRRVNVIGFNHNLQGSFGVTSTVAGGMRSWVEKRIEVILS